MKRIQFKLPFAPVAAIAVAALLALAALACGSDPEPAPGAARDD